MKYVHDLDCALQLRIQRFAKFSASAKVVQLFLSYVQT